jgi:predicted NUDIX family NTP pyrophosphohydrolase
MSLPPSPKPGRSAGVLLYRRIRQAEIPVAGVPATGASTGTPATTGFAIQVYLVHPGGPYFQNKDVWGIAKGLIEDGEDEVTAARREFSEETGFPAPRDLSELGTVTTHRGKVIHAFAGEWTHPGDPPEVNSNTCPVEWPRGSGTWIDIPEVDDGRFFDLEEARGKMHGCQDEFLDRLVDQLGGVSTE